MVVHKTHGRNGLRRVAAVFEVGIALTMRHGNRQAAAGHALQEQAGRFEHFHHRQAGLKALALVGGEARPVLRAGDDVGQLGKHLAAVAHAQAKGVGATKEALELRCQHGVEGNAARPANASAQRVAVAEATTRHHALEVFEFHAAGLQVGHVHVERLKARFRKGVGHFHMRVHALLAQDSHFGAREVQERCRHVVRRIEREVHLHAGVGGLPRCGVLGVGVGGVVTLLADLPAHGIPHLVQIGQRRAEHGLGIAPDLQLALARVDAGRCRARLANEMAELRQAMLAQRLHHLVAFCRAHLQHHAQFFIEQGLERELFAARTHLLRPVLGVAGFHAAVADAVALGHEHVHVQGHAYMSGKGHFGHGGQQATIAAVVVGQDLALGAQRVDGVDEVHQVLGVVHIGHHIAALVERLAQNAAAHAALALAQVHQHQRGVVFGGVELGGERAAHVGQRGKGAHDQAHGRGDLFLVAAILPLRAHGQAVLAHGNRDAQRGAQLHAHGLHGGVQVGILAGLAASGHPVGGQLDPRQLDGCSQQIGDGLGHRHAARCRGVDGRQRRAFAHAHGLARKTLVIGQRHGAIGHGHLPRAHHLVAVAHAAHGAVANGDEKALRCHRGVGQHVDHGLLQRHAGQVHRCEFTRHRLHIAVHLGRLAQQHVHGHVHRQLLVVGRGCGVVQHQLALFGGRADHGKRAALTLAEGLEQRQRFGRNGQHIALLALVAPDFLGRHARLFELHGAQIKARATACVVGQLGEGVAQTARTHVVNGQDGIGRALRPAMVDNLLRTALDLGVATLHRVKVELGRVGARGHGAGRTAAHTNAHARAAQLDQQRACGEFDFLGELGVNDAQATRDHDGLVVATVHARNGLLVLAEVAQQVGPAELVVERSPAQRAFHHDLQGAGDVLGLAQRAAPEPGHREPRHARLGLGAAPGGALVTDFAARASGCAGKR